MLQENKGRRGGRPKRFFSLALALALALSVLAGTAQASYGASANDKIVKIAANETHCLAVTADGKVFSWGDNSHSQLGNGTTTDKLIPNLVSPSGFGGKAVTDVKAGTKHSLALTADGNVYAWGSNEYGQLGDGTDEDRSSPTRVSALDSFAVTAIAAGDDTSFALTSNGKVYAWGSNRNGLLGVGLPCQAGEMSNVPVQVVALNSQTVTGISANGNHCLARTGGGALYAWGANDYGKLGVAISGSDFGFGDKRNTPVAVDSLSGTRITKVATSDDASLALDENGNVYEWGECINGQLNSLPGGNGVDYNVTPSAVAFLSDKNIVGIEAGLNFSVALGSDGKVYTWGENYYGQLGDGTNGSLTVPAAVSMLDGKNIVSIAAGPSFALALGSDGKIYAWGENYYGQLGNGQKGPNKSSNTPVQTDLSKTDSSGGGGTPGPGTDPGTDPGGSGGGGGGGGAGGGGTSGGGISSGGGINPVPTAQVASFGVTQKTVYVKRGKSAKLPFIAYATAAGAQTLTWTASKSNVATVEKGKATGKLTVIGNADAMLTIKAGKKPGSGKITLTSANGKKLVVKVNVVKSLKNVAKKDAKIKKLSKKAANSLKVGQVKTLKAKFTKKATAIATWKSSNAKVAKIDAAGKLTTLTKGTAKITLKVGGKKKVIKITVK
ncbi:MAG: Ig-like domain-containing protein [Clostridiales Family XIII bacterium]|nr:Ig-like domain-containing protein [Clostridiales Family XIII bacterium]